MRARKTGPQPSSTNVSPTPRPRARPDDGSGPPPLDCHVSPAALSSGGGNGGGGGGIGTPPESKVVLTGQKTNTGRHVDLHVSRAGVSAQTFTVVATGRRLLSLFDGLLLAFAFIFQLPYLGGAAAANARGEVAHLIAGSPPSPNGDAPQYFPFWAVSLWLTARHPLLLTTALVSPVTVFLLLLVAVRAAVVWFTTVSTESVTAIKGIGIQISRSLLSRAAINTVIDVNTIDALAIHEGYYRHRTVYMLVVVPRDSPRSIVLFEDTLPRLQVLRATVRGLRHVLYGEPENGWSLAELEARESDWPGSAAGLSLTQQANPASTASQRRPVGM